MRNLKLLIMISLGLLCTELANAQDAGDFVSTALDLSRTTPGGSARMLGLGEVQTSLGGDISSASSNPAGLGFFNKSEFSLTPQFNYVSSGSEYLDQSTTDARLSFNFSNLGAVIKNNKGSGTFKGGSIGISINRVADFQNQITYEGNNEFYDFIDYSVDTDNFSEPNDLTDLAYYTTMTDAYYDIYNGQSTILINGVDQQISELYPGVNLQNGDSLFYVDRNTYRPNGELAYPTSQNPTFQRETIKSRGAMYQTSFGYGGNYDDRLYFGANIGILTLNREIVREYIEIPSNSDLLQLTLSDKYEQNGTGVNATFGLIGRPIPQILVGASYTTPSVIAIEQIRSITLDADFGNFGIESEGIDYEPFNFTLTTPSKLKLGATCFIGKSGFITADAERVNYAGANLSNSEAGISFSNDNTAINQLESVWNLRIGGEFRYEIFRLRGGVARIEDPSKNNLGEGEIRISFGGGIRTEDYFVDMAVISSNGRKSSVSPYPGQTAIVDNKNATVSFTVGFFF